MNPVAIGAAVVLAVSLMANVFLGRAYLHQRDTATVAVVKREQATGAAVACDKGAGELVTKAAENKAVAAPKVAAAASAAQAHDRRADTILSTPAAVPGDVCKSAEALVDTWWAGRKP